MARTQEQRRAETRARLLDAAADLFARKGFHAVSAEAVADAADRTTGALYDHFGGKEGLLLALVDVWMEQTIAELRPALDFVPDLDERLGALWTGVVRRDDESGDAWVLLEFELWLHSVRDPELGAAGSLRFQHARSGLAEGLDRWSQEFDFVLPGPSLEVATQAIALLVGAAFQHRLDPSSVPQRTVVTGLRRLFGLPADPAGADAPRTVRARTRPAGRPPVRNKPPRGRS